MKLEVTKRRDRWQGIHASSKSFNVCKSENEEEKAQRGEIQNEKQGKSVQGEHTGIGGEGGAEDLLSVGLCMKKLKGETKNRQHANSQQRDDRVKTYTAWQHLCCCECSRWSVLWRWHSWGRTEDRSNDLWFSK